MDSVHVELHLSQQKLNSLPLQKWMRKIDSSFLLSFYDRMHIFWLQMLQSRSEVTNQIVNTDFMNLQGCVCVVPDSGGVVVVWLRVPASSTVPAMAFSTADSWSLLRAARCSLVTMAALSGPRASSCSTESVWRENRKQEWKEFLKLGNTTQILCHRL